MHALTIEPAFYVSAIELSILCVDIMKYLDVSIGYSDLITWRWFGPDRYTHALMYVGQSS